MRLFYKLLLALFLVTALNADSSRTEKWEFFFNPMFIDSNVIEFDGGAKADINSRSGIGFGFGYNVNEHIELSMLFSSSNTNYTGTKVTQDGVEEKFTENMYMSSFNLAATYNIIDGPLTPYISGFIGSAYVDSGVATGDLESICYWDPWWGYICSPHAETYTSTRLNYGGSVGVRYDFENMLFLKAGIGKNWIDFDGASSSNFTVYDLTIGATF